MKVLQINKFFYPHGGAESYLFSLISLLQKNGHEVLGFSQKNKNNLPIAGEKYFINKINLDKFYFRNIFTIGRIFWSFEAGRKIKQLINAEKPDLIHLHNIYHQISPSILPVIKKAHIPIVMTVHDFKLVNANYTLWAGQNKSDKPLIAKALMQAEYNFHKLINIYQKNIDLFIAPSEFVKNKLIAAGLAKNKITVLPHYREIDYVIENNLEENYFISFGRLDKSKGLADLIQALAQAKTAARLKIVGSGPEELNLKNLVQQLNLGDRIDFIPKVDQKTLNDLIAKSMFAVFPSLVHETFGLGVIESNLLKKPVIASNVGAFVENISDQTGLIFTAGNVLELRQAIEKLTGDKNLRTALGEKAFVLAQEKFSKEKHYNGIAKIYDSLMLPKTHFELEKTYAKKILALPKNSIERNQMIAEVYDKINLLVNSYRPTGIKGHADSTLKMIKKIADKSEKILDYGCGTGELVSLLNQAGYHASGFDVSQDTKNEAEKIHNLPGRFIAGDLKNLTEKYDLIVLDNVIEHVAPDETVDTLKNLKNILTETGRILIITPHRFAGPHDISGKFLPLGSKSTGLHLKEFNLAELAAVAKQSGFTRVSGYLMNPRILEKINLAVKPSNFWLKKSLVLEKILGWKILNPVLKLSRNLTRLITAVLFPTIIIIKQ